MSVPAPITDKLGKLIRLLTSPQDGEYLELCARFSGH
jgi:hypothetical protein